MAAAACSLCSVATRPRSLITPESSLVTQVPRPGTEDTSRVRRRAAPQVTRPAGQLALTEKSLNEKVAGTPLVDTSSTP
jgi:hypothetical protein